MNVRFIGCPSSGKTTVAATVFARLKEASLPVEFIPECARIYIAWKRVNGKLKPTDPLALKDDDQFAILEQQAALEDTISKAVGPDVIVISDTWALSSVLYLSPEARSSDMILKKILNEHGLPCRGDLVFYCMPVPYMLVLDPNRVHDQTQSLAIDALIPEVLSRYAPEAQVITLEPSTPSHRADLVMAEIFEAMKRG